MYNDENNMYRYSYSKEDRPRENVNDPGYQSGYQNTYQSNYQNSQSQNNYSCSNQQTPLWESEPPKPKKKRTGLKIAALALCCTLLGGVVGGGVAWGMMNYTADNATTTINVSSRPAAEVVLHEVDGVTQLTDAELYAANVNSVVSINVTGTSGYNFFGQATQTASSGSGFVLTADGYIVTNYHVVEDADTVKVTMYNGDEYDARYVGGDDDYDIAVIKVEAEDLQPVTLGDSGTLNVGDHVLAIGNPLGELTFSMSGGMVSSVDRAINVNGTPFNMIQTDASINSGNSGGPLFNCYGEVVGIVSAKYSSSSSGTSVEGLGFAIPMNDVFAMIEDIMTNGYVTNKPYMGITPGTMSQEMAAQYRYDVSEGVFVYSVEEGSAAEKAGLKMGDVILKVDDEEIKTVDDLNMVKKQYSAGDTVTLTIYREGAEQEVELTWDAVPEEEQSDVEQPQQNQNQSGSYYTNPYDMFDYFFGNRFGGY